MAKFLLVLCTGIVVFMYFNYPIYSEGFSFFIYVICLIIVVFAASQIYLNRNPTEEDYESVEKKADKLHANDGQFQYKNGGFSFKTKNAQEFVKWDEIISVTKFSIPLFMEGREIKLEINTGTRIFLFIVNETDGFEKLYDQLFENLPSWNLNAETVKTDNYRLEKTVLFSK